MNNDAHRNDPTGRIRADHPMDHTVPDAPGRRGSRRRTVVLTALVSSLLGFAGLTAVHTQSSFAQDTGTVPDDPPASTARVSVRADNSLNEDMVFTGYYGSTSSGTEFGNVPVQANSGNGLIGAADVPNKITVTAIDILTRTVVLTATVDVGANAGSCTAWARFFDDGSTKGLMLNCG